VVWVPAWCMEALLAPPYLTNRINSPGINQVMIRQNKKYTYGAKSKRLRTY